MENTAPNSAQSFFQKLKQLVQGLHNGEAGIHQLSYAYVHDPHLNDKITDL